MVSFAKQALPKVVLWMIIAVCMTNPFNISYCIGRWPHLETDPIGRGASRRIRKGEPGTLSGSVMRIRARITMKSSDPDPNDKFVCIRIALRKGSQVHLQVNPNICHPEIWIRWSNNLKNQVSHILKINTFIFIVCPRSL